MDRTFKLTLAYDGTDFAGWQVQPGEKTIQGELQRAFHEITGQSIQVIGSGRTDSGVHALAQVASCKLAWRDDAMRLANALNANLPMSIVVTESVDAPDGFHAIRDAIGKEYRYQLQIGGHRDVFDYRYRWHLFGNIDVESMRQAASRFLGRHDFAGFQASGSDRKTTTRDLRVCEVVTEDDDASLGLRITIVVAADGFLYNMVRTIVGTLVEIGRGKQPPCWVDELLAERDREKSGPTAPPQGLFLARVDYEEFGG